MSKHYFGDVELLQTRLRETRATLVVVAIYVALATAGYTPLTWFDLAGRWFGP